MFFSKSWLQDVDTISGIGPGWSFAGASGAYIYTTSGAVAPGTDGTMVVRRTTASAAGGELYAEAKIKAVNATSEVYAGFATSFSDTDLESSGLYARYNSSNTRFQIMRKVAGSATLTAVGSSITRALVSGDSMRLTVHANTATLAINGTTIITSSVSSIPEVMGYRFPALRFRNSTASRVESLKTGDYGLENAPINQDPESVITGGSYALYQGGALKSVSYIGMKVGGAIVKQDLELGAAPEPVYPSDAGYGPDPSMANAPALPASFSPTRTVNVSTSTQLKAAIAGAIAGDLIEMAPGIYNEKIVLKNLTGTAQQPIVLRGPKEAIMQLGDGPGAGGEIDYGSGYAFALDQCSYVWCVGFSVQYGPKGLMCDEVNDCWFKGLTISWVEQEAFHLRNYSNRNVIEDCIVHTTGRKSAGFGEAFYVGSANSNWTAITSRTNGNPDTCDNNIIRRCRAYNFTGEAVDIKEGTSGTVVERCWFDGSWLNDDNSADTWVDVKGNDAVIQYNYGRTTFNGAYTVYDPVKGSSGRNNTFRGNVGDTRRVGGAKSPDVSINIKVANAGNVVYSDNRFVGSVGSLANVSVTNI